MKRICTALFVLTVTLGLVITSVHAQSKDTATSTPSVSQAAQALASPIPPAAPPAQSSACQGGQTNPYEVVPSWPPTLPLCDINPDCVNSCRAQFDIAAQDLYGNASTTWSIFYSSFLNICADLDNQVALCIAGGGDPATCEAAVAQERADAEAFWGRVQTRLAASVARQLGQLEINYQTCLNQCCG